MLGSLRLLCSGHHLFVEILQDMKPSLIMRGLIKKPTNFFYIEVSDCENRTFMFKYFYQFFKLFNIIIHVVYVKLYVYT